MLEGSYKHIMQPAPSMDLQKKSRAGTPFRRGTACRAPTKDYRKVYSPLQSEQGSSLVELALTLPILLMLILGVIDLGLGLRTYGGLTNAAQEGARWLTTHPTDINGAMARITAEASAVNLAGVDLVITLIPTQSSYQIGDTVTVRVYHEYQTLFGALTTISTVPITVDVTMQVLYE